MGDCITNWDSISLDKDLQYEEEPIAVLDRDVRKLTKEIKSVKVQQKHHPVKEATWETKKDMREKYPPLFVESSTTSFFPQANFPKFVTLGQVIGKLISIAMTCSHRYRNANEGKFGL